MSRYLFKKFRMLDPERDGIVGGHEILIEGETIREVSEKPLSAPGAFADLLVIDGDPLKDLGLFERAETSLSAIMKAGRFHKNRLN